jgi:hypothetical protein
LAPETSLQNESNCRRNHQDEEHSMQPSCRSQVNQERKIGTRESDGPLAVGGFGFSHQRVNGRRLLAVVPEAGRARHRRLRRGLVLLLGLRRYLATAAPPSRHGRLLVLRHQREPRGGCLAVSPRPRAPLPLSPVARCRAPHERGGTGGGAGAWDCGWTSAAASRSGISKETPAGQRASGNAGSS